MKKYYISLRDLKTVDGKATAGARLKAYPASVEPSARARSLLPFPSLAAITLSSQLSLSLTAINSLIKTYALSYRTELLTPINLGQQHCY